MYHAIVRRRVRQVFGRANGGDWEAIVSGLAPRFVYRFVGDTPLGGVRTTHASMRLWFERLYRMFPGATFAPQTVVVHGWPWQTTVMTYVTITATVPEPGGGRRPYQNEFMQRMTLRWGRVTSVITLEDTQRLAAAMPVLAAAGVGEATAAPIDDRAAAGRS